MSLGNGKQQLIFRTCLEDFICKHAKHSSVISIFITNFLAFLNFNIPMFSMKFQMLLLMWMKWWHQQTTISAAVPSGSIGYSLKAPFKHSVFSVLVKSPLNSKIIHMMQIWCISHAIWAWTNPTEWCSAVIHVWLCIWVGKIKCICAGLVGPSFTTKHVRRSNNTSNINNSTNNTTNNNTGKSPAEYGQSDGVAKKINRNIVSI